MISTSSARRFVPSLLVATSMALPATAQTRLVVPSAATNAEQASTSWLPGIGFDGRVQFIVDPSSLVSVAQRNLVGLEFRHDATNPVDLTAGVASVVVRLGAATTPAFGARADLTANAPLLTEVYRGTLTAPASTVPGYVGWLDPHVLRIVFTQPYPYASGPLAIELEGSAAAHFWWPVDAATQGGTGGFSRIGASCSPLATAPGDSTLSVRAPALIAGGTAIFTQDTAADAAAILLFGLDLFPNPIPLASLGLPGCSLHVNAFAALPATMTRVDPQFGGLHQFHLQIPADPAFASAIFAVQGLELGASAGLATSEALSCQIATTIPSLGIAAVWSIGNGTPHVSHELVPVIGILHD
ncbi:MAG: hypothetical protein HZB39_07265 [Planctomycetes bacterium]|nr:hypothetical protein [Planctomycetota bacterium]